MSIGKAWWLLLGYLIGVTTVLVNHIGLALLFMIVLMALFIYLVEVGK